MDEQIEYMINFKLFVERDIIYSIYYIDPETNGVILIAKYIKKRLPEKEMNEFEDQRIPLPETLKLSIFENALNSTFFHSVVQRIIDIYGQQQYKQRLQKEKEERLQKAEEEQTTYNSSTSTNTTTTQDSNKYQSSANDTGHTPSPTTYTNYSNWNDSHQPTAAITYQPYNGISSDQWRQNNL
jgi:hypothetical protein